MEDNVKRMKENLNRHRMDVDPRLALVLRNSERFKERYGTNVLLKNQHIG